LWQISENWKKGNVTPVFKREDSGKYKPVKPHLSPWEINEGNLSGNHLHAGDCQKSTWIYEVEIMPN